MLLNIENVCIFDTEKKQKELKELLEAFSNKNGLKIEAIEIMPDHVHLVISFPPKLTPSSIVKSFKGAAASEWFKRHPEDKPKLYKGHLSSPNFFMSTVGVASK